MPVEEPILYVDFGCQTDAWHDPAEAGHDMGLTRQMRHMEAGLPTPEVAATKIQARYRAHTQRKSYLTDRVNQQAASTI